MSAFIDYYTTLGVPSDASAETIKIAFKKLALQYHPDLYKGDDAAERMRTLLAAYQTLSDAEKRRQYDAQRSEYVHDARVPRASTQSNVGGSTKRAGLKTEEVSPRARRDRQRHYAFPDIARGRSASFTLGGFSYSLEDEQAYTLFKQGLLRGVAAEPVHGNYTCHRCQHQWSASSGLPRTCPKCHADDWSEYLLLRCIHCSAVFESEQIRYEIGSYSYGQQGSEGGLCPPYELFPLCPYCGSAHWCPAEEQRVEQLRERATQRAMLQRIILISVFVVVVIIAVAMFLVVR